MWLIWLVAAAVLLAIEVHTAAFYAVFIAVGLGGGMLADLFGAPLPAQIGVIAGLSVVGVVGARPPLARMMMARRPDITLPGVTALVGQTALTVDEVGDEHHPGHAVLAGERWLAVTDGPAILPPDVPVIVTAVRGTTLHVRPATGAGS